MATYNIRRFSHAEGLKSIRQDRLIELLEPHGEYLADRGVELPKRANGGGTRVNYDELVKTLMTPDESTPKDLADSIFLVHEMSIPATMNALIEKASACGIPLDPNPDPTPADVATQVYLRDRELLERMHAARYATRVRSFEYFQTNADPIPPFRMPTSTPLRAMEASLDDWYEEKKRGRECKIFVYPKDDGVWFLVRHGELFKREGSLQCKKTNTVFYRPEKYDVLVYNPNLGELRMRACGKREKDLLRRQFGLHMFGREDFFPATGKYSLEPLRRDGVASCVCSDVDGLDWIKLKELHLLWDTKDGEIEIRKGTDVFAKFAELGRVIHPHPRIIRAGFQVKFADAKRPRTLVIRPSNIAQYTRDSDSEVLEYWMGRRGFITNERRASYEPMHTALARN